MAAECSGGDQEPASGAHGRVGDAARATRRGRAATHVRDVHCDRVRGSFFGISVAALDHEISAGAARLSDRAGARGAAITPVNGGREVA